MSSIWRGLAGLLLGALMGQPIIARADGQEAPSNLPADFIDSRPIIGYFDNRAIPDTVRDLLLELQRPDRCGADTKLSKAEACALVIYKLDDTFTPDRLRPPMIMRAVYRVSSPENPANTVMLMPDRTGVLKRYTGEDLFEPLRNIRANVCLQDRRMPDQCRATASQGVLYRPYGILGKLENDREEILPGKSAGKHFTINLKPADEEWLKEQQKLDLCGQRGFYGKPIMIC